MPSRTVNAAACALGTALLLALGACSSGSAPGAASGGTSTSTTAGSAVERGTVQVRVRGLAFADGVRTVAVGTKVVWTNEDDAAHTITAADKSYDSASRAKSQTFEHTYAAAGTFDYLCSIHPFMKGTITVVP